MSLIPIGLPTAVPTEPLTNAFANVDQSSVIITIILSFAGLAWAVFSYVAFTKWCCCGGASVLGKCRETFSERCCRKAMTISESREEGDTKCKQCKLWCHSNAVVNAFTTFHCVSKVGLVFVNIVYLARVGFHATSADILGLNKTTDLKATGASFANAVTFIIFILEIYILVAFPIGSIFQWAFCWKKSLSQNNGRGCSKFMEYLRFGDLFYAFLFAPFSNVDLFYLGGWWYIAIIARLAFYSITFAAAVIAGLRFIYALYCLILCECASNEDAVELRSYKHLFVDIGLKMLSIALKLMTCSSALATYLKLGILVQSVGFRAAYFSFTMLRGVTALFNLVFAAAMLRWAALKENEMESSTALRRVNRYEPQVHVAFFFDMLAYGGLLVLNFIIVYGINNNGFII